MERKDGYVVDIEYVHGVHRDLGPSALNVILLIQNIDPVALRDGFTYCDVGCGQGDSVNLFAACHPEGEFHAIDFNAVHIAGARRLAGQAGLANSTFWEANFADLGGLPLPAFDFIVMHGVYSWVGGEARRHILEFIRTKLKPGGVVYLSYNSLPGWSAHAPLRDLLISYADTQSGPLEQRIDAAVEFVKRLKNAHAAIFEATSSTGEFFEYIYTLPRNYLAHEFFNRDWDLFSHADVVRDLAGADVSFTGSASFVENQDMLRFSEAQQQILNDVTDKVLRETVKDSFVNLLLRRDLFTRGRTRMNSAVQLEYFLTRRFAVVVPLAHLERKAIFPIGEVLFDRNLYDPILSAFELKPQSAEELLQCPKIREQGMARVLEALIVLLAAEYVMPAVEPPLEVVMATGKLNRALLERDLDNSGTRFLASPVLQNAIRVEWLERLLIQCEIDGHPDPLSFVREKMETHLYTLNNNGTILQEPEEIRSELSIRIEAFHTCMAPLLRQLGVL